MSLQKLFFHKIKEWVPPVMLPGVLRVAVHGRFLFEKDKPVLANNFRLKDTAMGKDAFVLATGPSLKGLDLSFLKGKDCFSVSNFFLHDQIDLVEPKFHFFAPYHKPLVLGEYIHWLAESDKRLPPATAIVLGLSTKCHVEEHGLFSGRDVFYLSLDKAGLGSRPDLLRPVLAPQSSPIMALPLIYYMGYRRVFLLGCDHNILKNYGGVVSNFYSAEKDIRNNATSGANWEAGIVSHLEFAGEVFRQYKHYDDIYRTEGRAIYNMSPDGWLDFLEYSDVEEF